MAALMYFVNRVRGAAASISSATTSAALRLTGRAALDTSRRWTVGYCLQNGGRGSQPQHGGRCSFCDHAARMRAAREARERAARALIPADQATYWRRQWRCICYFHDYPGHTYFCSQYCPYLPLPPT